MLKSTERGIEIDTVRHTLSEDDLETILNMFNEYQELDYLAKDKGVWKRRNIMHKRWI